MRIIITSDLHYNIKRSRKATEELSKNLKSISADVLIIAGDIAGPEIDEFRKALELFADFRGIKLFVPGNHDLWVCDGASSFDKLSNLSKVAEEYDFILLDGNPQVIDKVGFVGTIGWYDYSFKDDSLAVPMEFYRAKVGPGRVALFPDEFRVDFDLSKLLPHHYKITSIWNDRNFVKLPFSDEKFTDILLHRLASDIEKIKRDTENIIAVTHHLPTRNLVWLRGDPNWDFASAFLGSQRFYEILKNYPQIKYCFSGHNHRSAEWTDGKIQFVSIGSTYRKKVLYEVNI